jgi:hypothetical protein
MAQAICFFFLSVDMVLFQESFSQQPLANFLIYLALYMNQSRWIIELC